MVGGNRDVVGDFQSAFNGLYRLAYKVAYRLTGSRAESEDIAQEALARAYTRWARVEGYAEAGVSRVSMNLAIDRVRRQLRPWANLLPPAIASGPPPSAERLDLQRALAALPNRQRQVVA